MPHRKSIHKIIQLAATDLHHLFSKIENQTVSYDVEKHHYYHVLPTSQLLQDPILQHVIKQLSLLCQLDQTQFKTHYLSLIEIFAEYVQGLVIRDGAIVGSLLKESLCQALLAVQVAYDVRHEKANPLLLYAIFSATLLQEIAVIKTKQLVIICDSDGKPIKQWNPFSGDIAQSGNYYFSMPYAAPKDTIVEELTLLLAYKLIPEDSFLWLSENDDIFEQWIIALINKPVDEWDTRRGLLNILRLIKIRLKKFSQFTDVLNPIQIPHKTNQHVDTMLDILRRIQRNILTQTISINEENSLIHLTESGIFLIYPYLFDEFIGRYARSSEYIVLVNLANAMGITKLSGQDHKYDQFFSSLPKELLDHLSFVKIHNKYQAGVLITTPEILMNKNMLIEYKNLILENPSEVAVKVYKKRMT